MAYGIPGFWTQVLNAGLWTLDAGPCTLDSGLLTIHFGRWGLGTGHHHRLFQNKTRSQFLILFD